MTDEDANLMQVSLVEITLMHQSIKKDEWRSKWCRRWCLNSKEYGCEYYNVDQVSGWLRIKTAQCEFLQLSCSSWSALLLVEAPTWSSHLLVSYEDGDDMDEVPGRPIWWYRCWLFFWHNIRRTGLVNFLPHSLKMMTSIWCTHWQWWWCNESKCNLRYNLWAKTWWKWSKDNYYGYKKQNDYNPHDNPCSAWQFKCSVTNWITPGNISPAPLKCR